MTKSISLTILLTFILLIVKTYPNDVYQADSMIMKLGELPNDTNKVNTLIEIIDNLIETNYSKALYYGYNALELAVKLNYYVGISRSYYYLGVTYNYKTDYKRAMISILEKMKIDEFLNDTIAIADNYTFIGNIYYQVMEYHKAHEYYIKSLKLYESMNYLKGLGFTYNNLGNIFEVFQQPEKAEENYLMSINIDKQNNDFKGLSITNNNLGNLYYKQFYDTSAVNYFYKAIKYLPRANRVSITVLVYNNLGDYFLWAENNDSALYYLNKAYSIAEEYNLPYFKNNIGSSLSKIYAMNNDFKKAFAYQSIHKQLNDSILSINNSGGLTLLEFQYEQEKEEIEQNLLYFKKQKKIKSIVWVISVFILIVTATTISFIIYQKSKIRESNLNKENIKIEALRLEEQLEFKNKEIVVIMMNLFERNELINKVVNNLTSILPDIKRTNYSGIENVITDLKGNYYENILKEFECRFQKVHINFFKNISQDYPNLTGNDLKLCAFLKMNMSTKDIASLTHQTLNTK